MIFYFIYVFSRAVNVRQLTMPSLRQRMTTYFRQLSFIAEPREDSRLAATLSPRNRPDDGSFITKYLEG